MAVGRRVEVRADLQVVTVTLAGRQVARHVRCWARHQSITDSDHATAAAAMRGQLVQQQPPLADEVQRRALSDYDVAFGLDDERVA